MDIRAGLDVMEKRKNNTDRPARSPVTILATVPSSTTRQSVTSSDSGAVSTPTVYIAPKPTLH
jgi:hypothetical protein